MKNILAILKKSTVDYCIHNHHFTRVNVRVKFLGAAGTVTGSKYLLHVGNDQVMVDCGLFQGLKENRLKNWDDLPVNTSDVTAIVLTHAHLDHTGYLPRLVKQGYSGPIYCTTATAELASIILRDAAKLQEEEAEYARKKGYSKHEKPQPLFDSQDAERAISLFVSKDFHEEFMVTQSCLCTFHIAGHILGAASISLRLEGQQFSKRIVFSGDLGRNNDPILHDPEHISEADILFVESTYGDRLNPAVDIEDQLLQVVNDTLDRGGCLLIPAFAVGRTQLMTYYLHQLLINKRVPSDIKVFIDSPMAINVTELYRKYEHLHKLRDDDLTDDVHPVFDYRNISYRRSHEESYKINSVESNAVILSASGMITGGRILHHMYNRLPNRKDTVLLAGYQAVGTRGRRLQDGEETIKMFGVHVPVKCTVATIDGLSAHADQTELMDWLKGFKQKPKMTFCVHGEDDSANAFAQKISKELGWNCFVPDYLESVSLFEGI